MEETTTAQEKPKPTHVVLGHVGIVEFPETDDGGKKFSAPFGTRIALTPKQAEDSLKVGTVATIADFEASEKAKAEGQAAHKELMQKGLDEIEAKKAAASTKPTGDGKAGDAPGQKK